MQAILPEVNPSTRTLKARVELANAGGALSPGMFVNIALSAPADEGLMVPTEAVIRTGKRNRGHGGRRRRQVPAGGSDDRWRSQRADADYRAGSWRDSGSSSPANSCSTRKPASSPPTTRMEEPAPAMEKKP